ncbi:MAG: S24 family peptidase [Muribaculaceae bacterium]|nr:S24 family peptidase [Muribaculaceae bacterium]
MVDRSILQERLLKAYNLLLDRGLVHNKQQFADEIGVQRPALYNALNNNGRVLTKGFLTKVADAFPDVLNKDYLLEGIGEVEKQNGKPHIPFEASAGGIATALGSVTLEECEKLPTISAFAHYDFTIDARGDSMEPSIQNGDTLYCRWCGLNTVISRPNRFYIVDTPEGAVVKQIKVQETCIICESLNDKYEPFKIEIVDDMRFAIVVGHSRKYE